jgi:phage virion morphogenesis protein
MVAVSIRVDVKGGSDADAWSQALSDPSPALAAVGEVLREDVEQRFQSQTDPWGAAWAPHSPVTIALRAARGRAGRILLDTRVLANSVFARVESARRVVVGIAAPYARVHQFGNPANRLFGGPRAPIPPRPMLPLRNGRVDLSKAMRDEVLETWKDALHRALEQVRQRRRAG